MQNQLISRDGVAGKVMLQPKLHLFRDHCICKRFNESVHAATTAGLAKSISTTEYFDLNIMYMIHKHGTILTCILAFKRV